MVVRGAAPRARLRATCALLATMASGSGACGRVRYDPRSVDGGLDGAPGPGEAGSGEAGPEDAGPSDAASDDAGLDDAGLDDAGLDDAGLDEAGVRDGGADDAGLLDGGAGDGGVGDAGLLDGGAGDAGLADGGLGDGGLPDAGGLDAGAAGGRTVVFSVGPQGPFFPVTSFTTAGGVSTFTAALPNGIGVGDQVSYAAGSAFVARRIDATRLALVTARGAPIADHAGFRAVTSVARVFRELAEGLSGVASATLLGTRDLVAANVSLHLACYEGVYVQNFNVGGFATDATHYVRVFAPDASEAGVSQRHGGVRGRGCVIRPAATGGGVAYAIANIASRHVRLEGIAVDGSALGDYVDLRGVAVASGGPLSGTDVRLTELLVHDLRSAYASGIVTGIYNQIGDGVLIANDIVVGVSAAGAAREAAGIRSDYGDRVAIVHNTVFRTSAPNGRATGIAGYRITTPFAITVLDNFVGASIGFTQSSDVTFPVADSELRSDSNITSDATGTALNLRAGQARNYGGRNSYATYFADVTAGAEDLHLVDTTSALLGAPAVRVDGAAPYADVLPVLTDIDGEARATTPSVGADEP